jgi:DNA topoisomerase-1
MAGLQRQTTPRGRSRTRRRGGWRRLGRAPRFRYVDTRGRPVRDDNALERIASLAIPPAWRDVWISPSPGARLQATGLDRAGRRQYRYHPAYREAQERAKFDRLVRFGELLPGLRENLARHVEVGPYESEWASAVAVTLINRAWFRVGSDRYARAARTYGVTTLHKQHVAVRGRQVTFAFPGKGRNRIRTTLVDEDLAAAVRSLLELRGGSRLFRFERDGETAHLTAAALNDYLGEHMGGGFTAKDFRTWGGTLTAAVALAEHGASESEADRKRVLAAVMRRVGEELGNTPAVARASYVSPAVVEQYRLGVTLEDFRPRRLRRVAARQKGLDTEERALLSLLRSWRAREAAA